MAGDQCTIGQLVKHAAPMRLDALGIGEVLQAAERGIGCQPGLVESSGQCRRTQQTQGQSLCRRVARTKGRKQIAHDDAAAVSRHRIENQFAQGRQDMDMPVAVDKIRRASGQILESLPLGRDFSRQRLARHRQGGRACGKPGRAWQGPAIGQTDALDEVQMQAECHALGNLAQVLPGLRPARAGGHRRDRGQSPAAGQIEDAPAHRLGEREIVCADRQSPNSHGGSDQASSRVGGASPSSMRSMRYSGRPLTSR